MIFNSIDIATIDNDSEKVIVSRRCGITVTVHGESKQFVTEKNTVSDTINALGISLGEYDVITPSADETVKDGLEISIDKVVKKTSTTTSYVSYNEYLTLAKSSNVSKLIEKTDNKIKITRKYRITYTNDKQTDSELIEQNFTVAANTAKAKSSTTTTTQTATQGTIKTTAPKTTTGTAYDSTKAISPLTPTIDLKLDKNGVPTSYKKLYTGKASAYTGGGTTASGRKAAVGYVAVNPNVIPYGTKLYIRSTDGKYNYGYAIAADTGGFVNMGRVADLYFATKSECINFGLRNIEIYVLS